MHSQLIFNFQHRFKIWKIKDKQAHRLLFQDSLIPDSRKTVTDFRFTPEDAYSRRIAFQAFFPNLISPAPIPVQSAPRFIGDSHFWQTPAATEQLVAERHSNRPKVTPSNSCAHTYLGLPWASYTDKKTVPASIISVLVERMRGYRALAEFWKIKWGDDVRVHTVCQHVRWDHLLLLWKMLNITDVHLSHCEPFSHSITCNYGITAHSWMLEAVNVVNKDRRVGLSIGKPISDKKLLAAFVGADMPHYRSHVRSALQHEADKAMLSDVLVDIRESWHLHRAVYKEQAAGQKPSIEEMLNERVDVERYNKILSDSVFSLCPEGAGPNTLRLWESLAVGAIPVVIVEDWIWPAILGEDVIWEKCVISVRRNEIDNLFDRLRRLRDENAQHLLMMQRYGMAVYKRFCTSLCF